MTQWRRNAGNNFNQYIKCIPEIEDIIFRKQQVWKKLFFFPYFFFNVEEDSIKIMLKIPE